VNAQGIEQGDTDGEMLGGPVPADPLAIPAEASPSKFQNSRAGRWFAVEVYHPPHHDPSHDFTTVDSPPWPACCFPAVVECDLALLPASLHS